jgi:hypothetical protein
MVGVADEKLLTHYFRFVVREESGPLRDRLQRGLVERALKTGNAAHTSTAVAVKDRVETLLRAKKYPQELVNQALRDLVARGNVEEAGTSNSGAKLYRLAQTRFEMLERAVSRVEEQERAFGSSVIDKIETTHGPLSAHDRRQVEKAFVDLVGTILGTIGELCALNLVEERQWTKASEYPRFHADLEKAVRGLPNEIQGLARAAFEETLRAPTPDESEYLFSIGQVFYIVELLQLDPELQALQLARFGETTLFLDTNLLLAALLEEHDRHGPVRALLRLCRSLKFELRYTERTTEEVDLLIDLADEDYQRNPPLDDQAAAELADIVESPFVQAYLRSRKKTKWSWAQYKLRISGWRQILQKQGIALETQVPRPANAARLTHLQNVLAAPRDSANGSPRRAKKPRAAEHDAHVLTVIEKLVQKDDAKAHPFGHRYWLLTLDRHLADCARKNARSDVGAVCMLAEEWVQYISPFLGPDVSTDAAADVFARLLGSRFFVSLGAGLDLEDLQPFTAPDVKQLFDGLSHEDACALVARAAQSEAVTAADPEKRPSVAIQKLSGLVEDLLRDKKDRGELVPRAEVDRLKHDQAQLAESSKEKDDEIAVLRSQLARRDDELAEARRQNRWSVTCQVRRFHRWALHRAWPWITGRRIRLSIVAALLMVLIASLLLGWGGTVFVALTFVAMLLSIVSVDPDVVKKNVRRASGSRQ